MSHSGGNAHARVNVNAPEAFAVCDRCGKLRNLPDLVKQYEYRGDVLAYTGWKVCPETCLDVPAEFLRNIKLPADPVPVQDPRQSGYVAESNPVQTVQQIIDGE